MEKSGELKAAAAGVACLDTLPELWARGVDDTAEAGDEAEKDDDTDADDDAASDEAESILIPV